MPFIVCYGLGWWLAKHRVLQCGRVLQLIARPRHCSCTYPRAQVINVLRFSKVLVASCLPESVAPDWYLLSCWIGMQFWVSVGMNGAFVHCKSQCGCTRLKFIQMDNYISQHWRGIPPYENYTVYCVIPQNLHKVGEAENNLISDHLKIKVQFTWQGKRKNPALLPVSF